MDLDFEALLSHAGLSGLQELPLERIAPDPGNPRRHRDETQLAELAASIRARGVLQPITVQPADETGVHIIRFGERRYHAARMAGLTLIPAIISNATSATDNLIDQTTENDQREPLSPADMVDAVERLIQAGHSHAEIGDKLGRPRVTISHYAAIPGMPERLRRLLPDIAVRTLYDLYQVWKRDPATVELFLEAADPSTITRRQVLALTSPSQSDEQDMPPAPEPSRAVERVSGVSVSRRPPAGAQRALPAAPTLPITGRLTVAHGARIGRLLFAPAPAPGHALVLFDEGRPGTPEPVPLDALRIVRLAAA